MAIWIYRIRRFLAEREVFISLVIFGVLMMSADVLNELEHKTAAARTRMVGIGILLLLFIADYVLRSYRSAFPIPLMLAEESDREDRRALFTSFLAATHLRKQAKVIEATTPVRTEDLIVHFRVPDVRTSADEKVWYQAWSELVDGWEHHLDRPLGRTPFAGEGRCYHVFPHIVLPLAFALGASVNLRRRIVLYHAQGERFHKVIDLSHPRRLFEDADKSVPSPKKEPKSVAGLPKSRKLILHIFISYRHQVQFQSHPDHKTADNAALTYGDLNPDEDWLPYTQHLVSQTRLLTDKYEEVILCLACPAVIAFALGMALSRNSKITVCHWLDNKYVPVFSLSHIEKNLPFD